MLNKMCYKYRLRFTKNIISRNGFEQSKKVQLTNLTKISLLTTIFLQLIQVIV